MNSSVAERIQPVDETGHFPTEVVTAVEHGRPDLIRVGNLHAVRLGDRATLCGRVTGDGAGLRPLPAVAFATILSRAPMTTCADCRRALRAHQH